MNRGDLVRMYRALRRAQSLAAASRDVEDIETARKRPATAPRWYAALRAAEREGWKEDEESDSWWLTGINMRFAGYTVTVFIDLDWGVGPAYVAQGYLLSGPDDAYDTGKKNAFAVQDPWSHRKTLYYYTDGDRRFAALLSLVSTVFGPFERVERVRDYANLETATGR